MEYYIFIFVLGVVLNGVTSQTVDDITSAPLMMQNPSTISSMPCNTQWEELLPTLKLIKSSSGIKNERLLNVVKIIKFLLADDVEKNQCDKILEEIKETNELQCLDMPDIDTIVEERLKPIKEALEGNNCILENGFIKEDAPKNKTADYSKILAKISAALAKVKENNENHTPNNLSAIMPIFRSRKNGCEDNQPLFESFSKVGKQKQVNPTFNIPCQRASDILEETSTFVIPKDAYCDLPANVNLKSILKSPKLNPDNLPFKIVPNSVSCVISDETVAILFKPTKISMMQVYGNLLKKITITVLVPYYVSKLVA